jgi:hypothetical protein
MKLFSERENENRRQSAILMGGNVEMYRFIFLILPSEPTVIYESIDIDSSLKCL